MSKWSWAMLAVLVLAAAVGRAQDYRVEAIKEAPPAGELSDEITAQLADGGFKVVQGEKRAVVEIWPAKQWEVKADFQPSDTVFSPIQPGSLVGVLRFARKGADFRGQDIAAGLYTLRYANQPVDGNHVGTFATRDFLLMLPAANDQSAKAIPEMDVLKASAESAQSSHPAIMPLVKPATADEPALKHLEEQNWWTLRLSGKDAKGTKIPMEVIVVGKAAE